MVNPSATGSAAEPTERHPPAGWAGRLRWGAAAVLAVALAVVAFRAATIPSAVDARSLVVGVVKRGPMAVAVAGGARVRRQRDRSVTAPSVGQMERVAVRAGDRVERGSLLLVMRNSELEVQAVSARSRLAAAPAAAVKST